MRRIKMFGLMLLAVPALSAVAVSAASATEGPFWKVGGVRLAAGETRLLLATAKEKFTLESKGVGIVITCLGTSLPAGSEMQIIGAAPGNGGTSEEAILFTSCTQTGNGEAPCAVENQEIKTTLVLNLLGYSNANRTGQVLVLFEPKVGKTFVTVHFVGAGCKFLETAIEGTTVGGAQAGGQPVLAGLVGSEPESLHGEVKFPHAQLIFIERGGVLKHQKAGLSAFGVASTLAGVALLLVHGTNGLPQAWGVFS
jgi:hypothetical protein